MDATPTTVIYARQSLDRTGEAAAVSRQLELCRKHAADRGWTVDAELIDNDRSATTGTDRPAFEELLTRAPARVIVWHIDRLVRLTSDLERVIEAGSNVYAVKAGHVDLSTPAGKAVARTITAWSTYEGEQKAARQRAANDQRAAAGLPYAAQRSFGYEADGMTIRESEAAELRAVAEGVIRGRSLNSLAKDLNERGVKTAPGNTWRATSLKAVLLSPRNAGLRRHRGEVVGKAAWPPIFDEETATTLRAILNDPARQRRGPRRKYLLSGIMRCEVCSGPVHGAFIKDDGKGATYRCLGHVSRKAAPVDEAVTALVLARLSLPDAVEVFTHPADDGESVTAWKQEQADLRARLDGLAEAFAVGDIDRQQLNAGTERIRATLGALDAKVVASVTNPALADLVTNEDIEAAWDRLPVEVRRQVIGELMEITLLRVGPGKRVFDPETSLRVEWRAA